MSLPPRGTGLLTGRARTVRGGGRPLTEAERKRRHATGVLGVDPVWVIAGLALASAAIIVAVNALSKT